MTVYNGGKRAEDVERARLKDHPFLNATPAQIDAWFTQNVTNLAQARDALRTLTKIVLLLTQRVGVTNDSGNGQ
jgi:hypothetical protein